MLLTTKELNYMYTYQVELYHSISLSNISKIETAFKTNHGVKTITT
jgi:hypothetical protein